MRIVILGNSHLGALRAAWSRMADRVPGVRIDFFGGIMPVFAAMTLNEGQVFGLHDAVSLQGEQVRRNRRLFGSDTVDLNGVDAVVVVGVDWHVWTLIGLMNTHIIDGTEVDATGPKTLRLSRAAFDAIAQALAADAVKTIGWAARIKAPVHVLPRPLPPETLLEPGPQGAPNSPHVANAVSRDLAGAARHLTKALHGAMQARGLSLIAQPAETRAANGLTAAAFKRGGLHLAERADDPQRPDFEHMNIDYGTVCMGAVLARLGADTATAAAPITAITHGG